MNYNQSIEFLIADFPELQEIYNQNFDLYIDLPYVFYENVFEKYIIDKINKKEELILMKIFAFIEKCLRYGDEDFKNLIEVAIIESLCFDGILNNQNIFWNLLGDISQKSFEKYL